MVFFEIYFVFIYLIDFIGEDEVEVMDNSCSDLWVLFLVVIGVEVII